MDKHQEFLKIKTKLAIIKQQDEIIRLAFDIYKNEFPQYSVDSICIMLADETGICRATVWNKIRKGNNNGRKITVL